jgi:hypothetical protein
MSTYETATLLLQAIIGVAVFATLAVYYHQLKVMGGQLESMQSSSRAQSALSLVNFLQSPEVREARECVREVLSQKSLDQWTNEERRCASLVCANYDVAAGLLKANLAPSELIVGNWTTSIIHCYDVLAPHMHALRQQSADQRYWRNFEWLYRNAKRQGETNMMVNKNAEQK